jgi:hypothetical protein
MIDAGAICARQMAISVFTEDMACGSHANIDRRCCTDYEPQILVKIFKKFNAIAGTGRHGMQSATHPGNCTRQSLRRGAIAWTWTHSSNSLFKPQIYPKNRSHPCPDEHLFFGLMT